MITTRVPAECRRCLQSESSGKKGGEREEERRRGRVEEEDRQLKVDWRC